MKPRLFVLHSSITSYVTKYVDFTATRRCYLFLFEAAEVMVFFLSVTKHSPHFVCTSDRQPASFTWSPC